MEMILLAATLASSTAAILMGVLAWRLIRDERRRSEARIAALSAAIAGSADGNDDDATVAMREAPVEIRDEATAFRHVDWPFDSAQRSGSAQGGPLEEEPVALKSDLFAAAQRPAPSRLRFMGIAAAGAVVILAIVAASVTAISIGRGAAHRTPVAAPAAPAVLSPEPVAAPRATPLELIALGHERQPDRLTVRGVVRNPTAGAEVRQLNAVVLLFDHDGGFVATARAPIDGADLAPGTERTFVVSIPAGADVERYRVSFRSDDHVVPHVDRRAARG